MKALKSKPQAAQSLPLGSSLGFLVREIHRMQARLLQDQIKDDGISGGGWYFLRVLWHEDGLTQRELSVRIGVNEATTRTAVDRMEKEQLVVRVQDDNDRRKWIIRLTPRAKKLEHRLVQLAIDLNNTIMEGLPPDERAALISSLQRVYKQVEQISPGPDRRRRATANNVGDTAR